MGSRYWEIIRKYALAPRDGLALLPSKKNPRVRRWQRVYQHVRGKAGRASTVFPTPPTPKGWPEDWLEWGWHVPDIMEFDDVEDAGGFGPVWKAKGKWRGLTWFLKEDYDDAAARAEVISSAVARAMGAATPPVLLVGEKATASLVVPGFTHRHVGRSPFWYGPGGPEGVRNYWAQVALGHILGDDDRHGGNYSFIDGWRWDIDWGLAEHWPMWSMYTPDKIRKGKITTEADTVYKILRDATPEAAKQYVSTMEAFIAQDPRALAERANTIMPEVEWARVTPEGVAAVQHLYREALRMAKEEAKWK